MVVHTTDGALESAAAWFANAESGVSAHYLVGLDGRVLRFVAERDTARHAGVLVDAEPELAERLGDDPNLTTIGIEFADDGDPSGVVRPDAQYEAGARLLREISRRWSIPLDTDHVIEHRRLRADKTCPGNLDTDRLISEAGRPLVVVLLPVRNEASRLPGWLERAAVFADAVIALDDGSTDETRALLEEHPLVRTVLANEPRESEAGWDDARNRQRLVEAAGELEPAWLVQLDADEWLDPSPGGDGERLREFLGEAALPGAAYGFAHFRSWEDEVDRTVTWVYRIFSWRPGLTLPDDRRLHFNPLPETIPRDAWLRTTFRIRHDGASDPDGVAARIAKYAHADPDDAFEANTGGMEAAPDRANLIGWEETAAIVGLGPGANALAPASVQSPAGPDRPLLAVLLPVRNGSEDLIGYFASLHESGLADVVIALDDGSTDDTRELLEAEPLVTQVLTNPVRTSYAGWNEPRDRQRLLDAAAGLQPRFVCFLDADERIDSQDSAALRTFLDTDATAGIAYGMRVHRMIAGEAYDRDDLWVYRLFAWAPDQELSEQPLHFVPIPRSISPGRFRRTTVRIRHLASLTEERREARRQKYRELDPDERYQDGYEHLLDPPGPARPWLERSPDLAVLEGSEAEHELARLDLDAPVLSAIVIAREDDDRIERVVRSVVDQRTDEPFETIVVVSGGPRTAAIVRERFPEVTLVDLPEVVLPGAARNAGLRMARGDYVSFPGSHTELAQGSLQARIAAHERGWPMVTGSIRNGTATPAGWASYFLDHAQALPGRPGGPLDAPPAHCSYDRDFLIGVGGFATDLRAGEDTLANTRLWARGLRAWREPAIVLTHASRASTPRALAVHHFARGRAFARLLFDPALQTPGLGRRRSRARELLGYLPRRLALIEQAVDAWAGPRERSFYRRTRSLVLLGLVAAWTGALAESARWAMRLLRARLSGR